MTVPARAVVAPPGPGGCGDYATSIALQLARPAGQPSRRVAEVLRPYLVAADGITDVVLTGPGFLNISLHGTAPADLVAEILRHGPRYGHGHGRADGVGTESGRIVQLHCPHDLRAVVVAEAAARILRSQGALVRTSCTAPPEPEWTATLGVRVDAAGPAPRLRRSTSGPSRPPPTRSASVGTPVAGPCSTPPPTTGPGSATSTSSSVRAIRSSACGTPTPAPAPSPATPPTSASPPNPVPCPARPRTARRGSSSSPSPTTRASSPPRRSTAPPTGSPGTSSPSPTPRCPSFPTVLPRGGEKPSAAHRARLALAEAVGAVLAGGLSLLGIDAPDHL